MAAALRTVVSQRSLAWAGAVLEATACHPPVSASVILASKAPIVQIAALDSSDLEEFV